MKTVRQVLEEAFGYIKQERCSMTMATSSSGRRVDTTDPVACCWCPLGAIAKACGNPNGWLNRNEVGTHNLQAMAIATLAQYVPVREGSLDKDPEVIIYDYNDNFAKDSDIHRLFETAIAACPAAA